VYHRIWQAYLINNICYVWIGLSSSLKLFMYICIFWKNHRPLKIRIASFVFSIFSSKIKTSNICTYFYFFSFQLANLFRWLYLWGHLKNC
jgi:hypothetical protein